MKARWTIQWKIPGAVLLFGCVIILVNHWRNERSLVERHLQRVEQEAADTGSRLSGVLQHLSRRQQQRAAELEMSYVSLSPDVDLGVVCDRDGTILYATQLQWRGVRVSESPLADEWSRVHSAMEKMAAAQMWDASGTRLVTISPFYEGYDTAERAAVLLRHDPSLTLARLRSEARHESVQHAWVLLALTLLLWFTLDELVGRRVRELLGQVRMVGTGRQELPPLAGTDELSMISREFHDAVSRLRSAERLALDAAEQERRRIGGDLHDDLCQRLSATKLKAEVMLNRLPPEGRSLAEEIAVELQDAVGVARGMAHGLSPVGLEAHGLAHALELLAGFVRGAFQVSCAVEMEEAVEPALDVSEKELVFRVAQELAANACKHSKPQRMSISLCVEHGYLVLTVIHDGIPYEERESGGMGLALMKQRLQALSAVIERSVEAGLAVTVVRAPLKK
ncbi:MAG: histidine kinase [Verrucomicrobiaceae bacterium]